MGIANKGEPVSRRTVNGVLVGPKVILHVIITELPCDIVIGTSAKSLLYPTKEMCVNN